jgi:arabinose-5-phosphate isomerase
VHGDLGSVARGDAVLCASYTGETEELVRMLPLVRDAASAVVAICGRVDSTVARLSDVCLDASVPAEACPLGLAPTASSTATLALGDALAMAVAQRKGFSAEDFGRLHPGGSLGRRFLKVRDLRHAGDDLPVVAPDTPLRAVIHEMTSKRLGMTCVVADGRLAGVISDGDLRRLLEREAQPLRLVARDVMATSPRTVAPDELAVRALALMEEARPRMVTWLVVVEDGQRPVGVLHVHDLWRGPR